ncbi:MAG: DNA polymerase ligase N-terminal domain-containing protein [Candidatus Hodarchaeota archaeon]
MSLEEYWKKRDFKKTKEPKGKLQSSNGRIYVIQKHDATRLHYDLRLQREGVLKSWAIPKEPPTEKGIKRLAIETEDHPIDYADFQGLIAEGEYGAGTVETWDKGEYHPEKWEESEIIINIDGKKLKGRYCLIRFKKEEKSWLFFKCR